MSRVSLPSGLLARVRRDAGDDRAVVLIDGGSGSGKTTLATSLVRAMGHGTQLVSLDDVYPGWGGLLVAARAVPDTILRSRDPGYRSWDWRRDAPGPWRSLDPAAPIVVEGCGAITPDSRAAATTAIWLAMGHDRRRSRALARHTEGHDFADYWDMWAAQERQHWRRHRPRALASVIVSPS